jgi:hypothetical protein
MTTKADSLGDAPFVARAKPQAALDLSLAVSRVERKQPTILE